MTNGYERFDDDNSGGGGFVLGLLTGALLGTGLGLLFAPKAGSEFRSQISGQAENLAKQASEGYQKASDTAGEWASQGRDKGREMFDKAKDAVAKTKDAVARGTDEAERYVRDASGGASTLRRG